MPTNRNKMKLSKLFSEPDLSSEKLQLRERLSDHKSTRFPNGIYGQIEIAQKGKQLTIKLPFNPKLAMTELETLAQGVYDKVEFAFQPVQSQVPRPANVKTIVAVASGKGGVGKSTVTANLAATLAKQGHKVGVLDADIYGPSVPIMFGLDGESVSTVDEKTMEPLFNYGVFLNSIGFLIPEGKAAIWRGPMASRALMQILNETNWPELDVLLVDMPPGTGDIQLTMSENIKCDGALVVTTPQNVALADAEKGIAMFEKVSTPVLGLVENMSQFVCGECGSVHHLFGQDGGAKICEQKTIPLLAQLPLIGEVRAAADSGKPYVLQENTENHYEAMAFSLMMQLSKQTQQIIALA